MMKLTTSQMLMIFGVLTVVYFVQFLRWFVKLEAYLDYPKFRRRAINATMKNGMLFSISLSVVIVVLMFR